MKRENAWGPVIPLTIRRRGPSPIYLSASRIIFLFGRIMGI